MVVRAQQGFTVGLACVLLLACGGSASVPGKGSGGFAGASAAGATSTGGSSGAAGNPSGGATANGGGGSSNESCQTASDCGWGEISHDILKAKDCMCLFGCPYLPQAKTTVTRRAAQYQAVCTPGKDGDGNPCPIDDCAEPGALACVNGICQAARTSPPAQ